jgi:ABC-type antimicrobial peptide transport system permease subunit
MPFVLGTDVALNPRAMVSGLVLAAAVGLWGGLLPAWQASRLRIVDVLR